MTAPTNGAADNGVEPSSGAHVSDGYADVTVEPAPKGRRFRFRKFDESVVHDAVHHVTDQFQVRIAELEAAVAQRDAELEEARGRVPDFTALSNADLAVLASDAAASILRVARTEADASSSKAAAQLADAEVAATQRVEEAEQQAAEILRVATDRAAALEAETDAEIRAKREAADAAIDEAAQRANEEAAELAAEAQAYSKQVSSDADSYAERVRDEADEYASQLRIETQRRSEEIEAQAQAEAQARVSNAKKEIEARLAKAHAEGEQIVQAAVDRREVLFADLEVQRRLVQSTLEDAASIQAAFVEGYGRLRKTLDESVAHLIEPVQRARRQLANIDRELAERENV